MTRIISRAPTRIDLAGGTMDIWPLYLFLKDPVTVNLGIDLFAETRLEETPARGATGRIHLRSDDQNIEMTLDWAELADAKAHPALELHLKLLRHFARGKTSLNKMDLSLSTRAKSPAGAGLGGSSTLSISIVGALGSWAQGSPIDPAKDGERFIDIVRDVETTVIQVPAGLQDYFGAMFGGLQALSWGAGMHDRQWLQDSVLDQLQKRLLLFYSGQSRNSGINNWALFKGFIDKDQDVRSKFERINEATRKLLSALRQEDWTGAGKAIAEEWATRKTLAKGISTPEMDQAFAIAQRDFPFSSGKVCGAGGGGCFFVYMPEPPSPTASEKLISDLASQGVRHLPFEASKRGLSIQWGQA